MSVKKVEETKKNKDDLKKVVVRVQALEVELAQQHKIILDQNGVIQLYLNTISALTSKDQTITALQAQLRLKK